MSTNKRYVVGIILAALGFLFIGHTHGSTNAAFYWKTISYFLVASLGSFITILFYSLRRAQSADPHTNTMVNVSLFSQLAITVLASTGFFCPASAVIVFCYMALAVVTHGLLLRGCIKPLKDKSN